jgi:hypothetical protein
MTEFPRILTSQDHKLVEAIAQTTVRRTITEMTDSVPGVIPQWISDSIRETVRSEVLWTHTIPVIGSYGITVEYRFVPNGTIRIVMSDMNGERFWTAILRPPMPREKDE